MKTPLKGWHKSWFYCKNHEPSLPPFVGRLIEYNITWHEEPTSVELPIVASLTSRVNDLKRRGLTRVCVATNWLAFRVMPLKKPIHSGWEYGGHKDPTRESTDKIEFSEVLKLLQEMFNNTSSWSTPEQVHAYHLGVERDLVRQ
jgi:hypothetical protein